MSKLVYSSSKGFIPGYFYFDEAMKPDSRSVEVNSSDRDDDDFEDDDLSSENYE